MNNPFAEVIQSTLTSYIAQSWEWNNAPSFGSLVQVTNKDRTVYGFVTSVSTGSSDPMRTPFAYKKTEEELRAQQPHIFEFLQTTFTVHVVAYQPTHETIVYLVPPTPCSIHGFVSPCTKTTMQIFFAQPNFLHTLFAYAPLIACFDELLLAIINQLSEHKLLDRNNIDAFCKLFSLLTGNDYRRLKIFLARIQPLVFDNNT